MSKSFSAGVGLLVMKKLFVTPAFFTSLFVARAIWRYIVAALVHCVHFAGFIFRHS